MRIATWNINSLSMRINHVLRFLESHQPDVLCLQETKLKDDAFPGLDFIGAGYPHHVAWGQGGYNGVAIISKHPIEDHHRLVRCGRNEARHIQARISGLDIHSVYLPSGGYEPKPEAEKFAHKLAFLEELTDRWDGSPNGDVPAVIVGDLNIAPLPNDVWDHEKMLKAVSHTPIETEGFAAFMRAHNLIDAVRKARPTTETLFSWWTYRRPNWREDNKGRRLDHILASITLADKIRAAEIYTDPRDWEKPSDHVPVIVDIEW